MCHLWCTVHIKKWLTNLISGPSWPRNVNPSSTLDTIVKLGSKTVPSLSLRSSLALSSEFIHLSPMSRWQSRTLQSLLPLGLPFCRSLIRVFDKLHFTDRTRKENRWMDKNRRSKNKTSIFRITSMSKWRSLSQFCFTFNQQRPMKHSWNINSTIWRAFRRMMGAFNSL